LCQRSVGCGVEGEQLSLDFSETQWYRRASGEGEAIAKAKMLTGLLKVRFGEDLGIGAIVVRLADLEPEEAVQRVCEAQTIDALR